MKLVYVLLDGVGDLPHPSLNDLTPLEAAYTPNMDKLARKGVMGQVYSVGKRIAPESDIAVFNMLGYRFKHEDYVGRGVIEAIGAGIDLRDGDLALRGNFATIDGKMNIVDRRVGRSVTKEEAEEIVKAIQDNVKLDNASFTLLHTTGHRVVLSIRSKEPLSSEIGNTDPAYERVKGMGVAKSGAKLKLQECKPLTRGKGSLLAAKLVNEFTKRSLKIMKDHPVNIQRRSTGKLEINSILFRDAGNTLPRLQPINEMYKIRFSCIVDMPVEKGIAKVTGMDAIQAGGLLDYEEKARNAINALDEYDAVYVHLKGPDEFGHDGDAWGKKKSIEDIDKRFFGTLADNDITVVISGDHSTPCIKKGHSADPIPLLVSNKELQNDGSSRFTEKYASKGRLGALMGYQVLSTALDQIVK